MELRVVLTNFRELTPVEEVEYRYDCPFCGGANTFSITRVSGKIFYNCFRNSCSPKKSRGLKTYTRTIEELKSDKEKVIKDFILPDYFEFGPVNEKIIAALRNRNSWEAYEKGYVRVGYDPREERLLFFLLTDGKITGAVGRSLSHTTTQKSKIYPNSKGIFKVGTGSTAVIVEDCFSACSVARSSKYVGISLNGTNLTNIHLTEASKYDKVIIALDKDATRKSIKLAAELNFMGIDTKVKYLEQDLKDCKELPEL